MRIPVRNIYYLLCYAWDHLEEGELVDADRAGTKNVADLFARVLDGGVRHVLRRGLDRSYTLQAETIAGVRGRIDLGVTMARQLHLQARTHCWFDELSHDVDQNRILKATVRLLMRTDGLDAELHDRLAAIYKRLGEVSDITLTGRVFRTVQIHRNNRFYSFLLQVCRFVYENVLVGEAGKATFRDFLRDERQMAYLFQQFVVSFYKREQRQYKVHSPQIRWLGAGDTPTDEPYLPVMQTDLVLKSSDRALIIDTKYYAEALQGRYGKRKVRSDNLYQLFAYLKNYAASSGSEREVAGMLLYPTVSEPFVLKFDIHGMPVTVRSVSLDQEWPVIHDELLAAVRP